MPRRPCESFKKLKLEKTLPDRKKLLSNFICSKQIACSEIREKYGIAYRKNASRFPFRLYNFISQSNQPVP